MKLCLLLVVILSAISCRTNYSPEQLTGTWKTDSIYTYDNGYAMVLRNMEEEPLQHYETSGRLKMTLGNESRWFQYEVVSFDSLIFRNLENKPINKFRVLELNEKQLVIKKQKPLLFPGSNQERYEIRYLSKIR